MNWKNFVEELNVESLEAESYHFRIWKYDQNEEKVTIMQGEENDFTDALDVECSVPNDTWHFEIVPKHGWITTAEKALWYVITGKKRNERTQVKLSVVYLDGKYDVRNFQCRHTSKSLRIDCKKSKLCGDLSERLYRGTGNGNCALYHRQQGNGSSGSKEVWYQ